MKNLFAILCILSCIGCSQKEHLENSINKTYVEFGNSTFATTIPFTTKQPYILYLPYQVFNNNLQQNDTIIIEGLSNFFAKNKDFFYDSIQIVSPNTLKDSIKITIKSSKIFEGGTFELPFKLSSKNKNITISKNYEKSTLVFTRESFINYFSGEYSCYETNTNATYDVKFEANRSILNSNITYNKNFWDFPAQGEIIPFVFDTTATKLITIPETEWHDKLGNKYIVNGDGGYDFSGNFNVNYYMKNLNGEIYQQGKQFYTKKINP